MIGSMFQATYIKTILERIQQQESNEYFRSYTGGVSYDDLKKSQLIRVSVKIRSFPILMRKK